MPVLNNQIAVITGASSGIGRSIALNLALQGAKLGLVGRNVERLEAVAAIAQKTAPKVLTYSIDLSVGENIGKLKTNLERDFGQVDLLIHSAGAFSMGLVQETSVEKLDWLYQNNVRAPYLLTQTLLPMIVSSQGQIVFINSSVILGARANVGQFAATQHALKAIADSLREEVNTKQVRVLSIFPGRTATPRQANIHEMEGKPYHPERLMQPEDIASVVINALSLPRTVEVTDINLRPFAKPI
ncbi:SDR family oxidoreductase [Hydrocoleum sp. CS-953]|uniref:SDR family oxidoreductase n=1 Tax=Hydrocoleum sp. CS-953 TaxID=1671698 RepID=UPI000B9AABC3|nr:SDR family NAD(P)-dependent oxidoreductase [Hydrocoleum sp. CS-953]